VSIAETHLREFFLKQSEVTADKTQSNYIIIC